MRKSVWFVLLLVALLFAQIPRTMNYQGKLTNFSGVAITGTHNVRFIIYGSIGGTDSLWWEDHTAVEFQKGLFSVNLGSINPLDIPFDRQYWMCISIDGTLLSPRMEFTSSAYAFHSATAEVVGDSAIMQDGGNIIFNNSMNVGIGTATPSAKLDVVGNTRITGMLEVTVGIDPPFIAFIPQATRPTAEPSHPHRLWVDESSPGTLFYYDGVEDHPLTGAGGGSIDTFVAHWDS
ncbi:hypothetical protein J7L68_01095, partial [bacterium]|nr:hypothetical protein [bacterium]